MIFQSLSFILLFMPVTLAGWYGLHSLSGRALLPKDAPLVFLTLMSCIFYGRFSLRFLALLLISACVNYCVCLALLRGRLSSPGIRRGLLALGIRLQLSSLFVFQAFVWKKNH